MLYDEINVKDVVDSESALEFMKEATKLASSSELENIGQKLEEKSHLFYSILNQKDIESMTDKDFAKVVGKIFSIRRKSKRLLKANGFENLRGKIVRCIVHFRSCCQYEESRDNPVTGSVGHIFRCVQLHRTMR